MDLSCDQQHAFARAGPFSDQREAMTEISSDPQTPEKGAARR